MGEGKLLVKEQPQSLCCRKSYGQAQWLLPLAPALGKEPREFKVILSYTQSTKFEASLDHVLQDR